MNLLSPESRVRELIARQYSCRVLCLIWDVITQRFVKGVCVGCYCGVCAKENIVSMATRELHPVPTRGAYSSRPRETPARSGMWSNLTNKMLVWFAHKKFARISLTVVFTPPVYGQLWAYIINGFYKLNQSYFNEAINQNRLQNKIFVGSIIQPEEGLRKK